MARLDEIAEGICTILAASQTPEPLNISLRGEGNAETTFLVRAIIESCQRQGLPISEVCVAPDVGADLLKQYAEQAFGYN